MHKRDDLNPHFVGTYHITLDHGVFINDPDVRFLAVTGPDLLTGVHTAHIIDADDDEALAAAIEEDRRIDALYEASR